MRKGQIEIIGLAVLVVVLVIILIIALTFSSSLPDKGNNDIRSGLIANNLVNSIIKEQTQGSIRNFIEECYLGLKIGKNKVDSCGKLDKEINNIVLVSIGNRKYEMKFKADNLEFYKLNECKNGIESTQYRFKNNENTFTVSMKIC